MEQEKPATTEEARVHSRTKAAFPRLTLSKVMELPSIIKELGDGDPVPRLVIFDKLNKSPDSGPSRMLVSTSNAYGLTSGSYKAERLTTTELGKSLLGAKTDAARMRIALKVLLTNDLFSQFYNKYVNRGVPQEALGMDFLKQTGSLTDSESKAAYGVFVDNLREQGFIKDMSGRPSILPIDLLVPEDTNEPDDTSQEVVGDDLDRSRVSDQKETPPQRQKVNVKPLPQFNFNIQIQLPENGTAEQYDTIFKSMSEHLLNYGE
jgi:hypothetical protein